MAIIRKEAYFSSCNNVNNVRTLIWTDDEKEPVGVVQIAHGISEHIGRYDEFARYLCSEGFVVCGNDHLGHGKTAGTSEELGYVYEGDHINMVRDMNTLHRIMSNRYKGLPYFMFGHSMGSFLARIYAASFGEELAGAVFCATGQLPLPLVMLEDYVDNIVGMFPENSKAADSVNLLMGKFTKKLLKDEDDLAWISKDEENRENFRNDAYCNFSLTMPLAKALVLLTIKASEPDWASKLPKNLPVLLVSGAKDPVGMFGRGVLAVNEALNDAGLKPEMILYPGDRHEIIHEADREKVFEDIKDFLEDALEKRKDD